MYSSCLNESKTFVHLDNGHQCGHSCFDHFHRQNGHTIRQIPAITNTPSSTVQDIISLFRQTDSTSTKRDGRAPTNKSLTARQERLIARTSVANPRMNARQIQSNLNGNLTSVSLRTFQRSLKQSGRVPYRPRKSPNLSQKQMSVRLTWALKFRHWTEEDWRKVTLFLN